MTKNVVTAKAGTSTVEFDLREVMAIADRMTKGAVSTFVKAAHRQMDPVVSDATTNQQLWPRRTGASQAGTVIEDRITPDSIRVTALNRVPHTYRLRFSIKTSDAIDQEAREFARTTWERLAEYVDRVGNENNVTRKSTRGTSRPYAGHGGAKQRVAHRFIGMASRDVWNKWWLRGVPSEEVIRAGMKGNLIWRHGKGAPNAEMAGKHVWSARVRQPVKRREAALIDEARDALDKLAKG